MIVMNQLVFVVVVVGHVPVPQKSPLDKDRQSAPAQDDDSQLHQVRLAPEVTPLVLLHQLAL